MSVCASSVTLVHPAKPVGRNEMLFGRDTHVIVFRQGSGPPTGRGDLGVGNLFYVLLKFFDGKRF